MTDLFTRFMPMIALGAALLIAVITAIFLGAKKGTTNKEFTTTRQHHLLDEPEQTIAFSSPKKVEASHEKVDQQAQRNTEMGNDPDIRALAKQYKAKAAAMLPLHPSKAAAIFTFMQTCDEIMYAPIATSITTEALQEMFAELKQQS